MAIVISVLSAGSDIMTLGEKIKQIRKFRGLTQKQLGMAIGIDDKTADIRIAQYETGIRTPKTGYKSKLAKALKVSEINFMSTKSDSIDYIAQSLFWLDEIVPIPSDALLVELYLVRSEEKNPFTSRLAVFYKEWILMQSKLSKGVITREEYFEWKLNWTAR